MSYAEAQYTLDEVNNVTGIPPMQVSGVKVQIKNGNTIISFTANDSVLDGHTICYVDKVVIVRKVDSAPTSINDGTVVATIDREHFGEDYELTGYSEIAYYAFFTVSDHGVVNEEPVVKQATSTFYRAAFHQDFSEKDPSKTITYLNWGDINSSQSPMYTNEGTGTATYGDWEDFFILQQNKPYMVKSDWTADYALDPDDYTKKLDGTASDVANTSYSGLGAYAWMPRFYMKEVYAQDGNSRDVYFSSEKEDSDFQPVGFYDYNVGEVKGVWIPMFYPGSDGKSFSGRTGYNVITSKTTDQQKAIVDLCGSTHARFLGGSIMNAYRDLCYLLYKHTNIQEVGGYGNCNGYNSSSATYGMKTNPVLTNGNVKGFKGTGNSSDESTRKQANKAFHSNVLFTYDMYLRDPYTLGYGNGSGQIIRERSLNNYNLAGNSVVAGDVYSSAYRERTSGYSSKLEQPNTANGSVAIKSSINYGDNGGSQTTGLCDYDYFAKSSGKTYVARRLGYCYSVLNAGPAYLFLGDEASNSNWLIGAAVLLIPPADYEPEG